MEFIEDKNRRLSNCIPYADRNSIYQNSANALECRLVFKKSKTNEVVDGSEGQWEELGKEELEALLAENLASLKLLSKQEVMAKLKATREYLHRRLAQISDSRSSVSDFITQMTDGADMEDALNGVISNLHNIGDRIYEEEAGIAYDRYKDEFEKEVQDILGTKAEIQRGSLERFINDSPSYLERVSEKARSIGGKELIDLVDEAKALIKGKSESDAKEEVKRRLTYVAGEENDMSPTEYESWSEDLEYEAKQTLDSWLGGYVDADGLDSKYDAHISEARSRGGEKAVLKLRTLRHEYSVRRHKYELSELAYVRRIFGEDGEEGEIHRSIRTARGNMRSGLSESDAKSAIWQRLAELTEEASSGLGFLLEDGEIDNVQTFIGGIRTRDITFDKLLGKCNDFRDSLSMREQGHRASVTRYEKLSKDSKTELIDVSHDALVYGFAYKDLTEKDTARESLGTMHSEMGEAMDMLKEDFASGDMERVRGAAYTLERVDDFLTTVAVVDLGGDSSPASHRHKESREPASVEHLLGAFDAFKGHETDNETVVAEVKKKFPKLGAQIEERIGQVGGDVRFVDRESFDAFFDGNPPHDNFQGLAGAFHNGVIFYVYPLDKFNRPSVKRMYKLLTHETIHHTMHESETSGATGRFLNTLLYGDSSYSEEGLQSALAGNTIGAQIIHQFMKDRGSEFQDWIQKRTKINGKSIPNGDLTFEQVIAHEDIAKEILEETITVYLTYYALNGRQQKMKPPYLDYLRQLHETPHGANQMAAFIPGSKSVSLGADEGGGESGIPAAGAENKENVEEVPDLDTLTKNVESAMGSVILAKNLMEELYKKEDYNGILADARGQLGDVVAEIARLQEEEKETGMPTDETTRKRLNQRINSVKDNIEKNMIAQLQDEKHMREAVPEDELGYAERLWQNTTFASIDDVMKIFQDGWAYLKERRELRRDRVSSEIGESIAPTERMSSYFAGLNQAVQNRDVSKWKEIYTDKDPKSLNEVLDRASDLNQVKAIFEMKASTYGDFFFRDPQTLGALTRVSGKKVETYYQAKAVFDELYGQGEAEGLERQNASARQGKVNEAAEIGKSHAESLGKEWMKMIGDMQNGDWVDTAKFEGFIHYALKAGKSYQRQVMWVIAKGFQLGILDYKTLVEMGGSDMIGNDPLIEYMGLIVVSHEAGKIYKGGKTELDYIASLDLFTPDGSQTNRVAKPDDNHLEDWIEYENWLLNHANKQESVKQRFGKIKSSLDKVDHDYIQDMWWDFNIGSYESIFNERTGAVQFIQDEGLANVYAQFVTNSLHWSDDDLSSKFTKWFRTDKLLVEENYANDGNSFQKLGKRKQKNTNRTVLDDAKLEVTGAMNYGMPLKYFRNLTYHAYKHSGGDMQVARDIMMAGSLSMGNKWTPKPMIEAVYKKNGWVFANVESRIGSTDPKSLPDAPQAHLIEDDDGSMSSDLLGGYPSG